MNGNFKRCFFSLASALTYATISPRKAENSEGNIIISYVVHIYWSQQLKNIPVSFYESAKLDGAGVIRRLTYITIPMCSPMILYNLIMNIIGVLQTYASVVTLVEGNGVNDSMLFYVMNIYNHRVNEFGYACALSFILFVIIGLFSLLVMKTSKWVYYTEGG